jgi:cysteine desulfurase
MKNIIYCDNAATTKTRPEVIESMLPVFSDCFGNASSLHKEGQKAKKLLDNARNTVSKALNCESSEIVFTSGGTESNNIAICGLADWAEENEPSKNHIITCITEHSSVRETIKELQKKGFKVTWLKVNQEGFINLEELEKSITEKTLLVSIMHANNEIGTIQDIKSIGEICNSKSVFFHTDAVQSAGKIPLDLKQNKIDLLSISGHKIYGPKGIGILYIRNNLKLKPLLFGGSQERAYKPGTENLPSIVGIAKALELKVLELEAEILKLRKFQNLLLTEIFKLPNIVLNGTPDLEKRIPGNINISFQNLDGDAATMKLNLNGICASSGSACSEGGIEPSPVIQALYLNDNSQKHLAYNSLRISLGLFNEEKDILIIAEAIKSLIN